MDYLTIDRDLTLSALGVRLDALERRCELIEQRLRDSALASDAWTATNKYSADASGSRPAPASEPAATGSLPPYLGQPAGLSWAVMEAGVKCTSTSSVTSTGC